MHLYYSKPEISADKISNELSEMVSKRVAALVMILVIVIPFTYYESIDLSLDSWLENFDHLYTSYHKYPSRELRESFVKFYEPTDIDLLYLKASSIVT